MKRNDRSWKQYDVGQGKDRYVGQSVFIQWRSHVGANELQDGLPRRRDIVPRNIVWNDAVEGWFRGDSGIQATHWYT